MTPLMLDTSAYAFFKRGNKDALTAIQEATSILIPLPVLGELWGGFAVGSRNQENREELDTFLQSRRVKVVPIISDTAERYAFIYTYLRKAGRPIPTNDLWIAASAMEHSAILLTADQHFQHVPQILLNLLVVSGKN
jgi:tRNA(fMet)-specific endonuclease VapC